MKLTTETASPFTILELLSTPQRQSEIIIHDMTCNGEDFCVLPILLRVSVGPFSTAFAIRLAPRVAANTAGMLSLTSDCLWVCSTTPPRASRTSLTRNPYPRPRTRIRIFRTKMALILPPIVVDWDARSPHRDLTVQKKNFLPYRRLACRSSVTHVDRRYWKFIE